MQYVILTTKKAAALGFDTERHRAMADGTLTVVAGREIMRLATLTGATVEERALEAQGTLCANAQEAKLRLLNHNK